MQNSGNCCPTQRRHWMGRRNFTLALNQDFSCDKMSWHERQVAALRMIELVNAQDSPSQIKSPVLNSHPLFNTATRMIPGTFAEADRHIRCNEMRALWWFISCTANYHRQMCSEMWCTSASAIKDLFCSPYSWTRPVVSFQRLNHRVILFFWMSNITNAYIHSL